MSEEMKDMEKQNREAGEAVGSSEDTAAKAGTEGVGTANSERSVQGGAGEFESSAGEPGSGAGKAGNGAGETGSGAGEPESSAGEAESGAGETGSRAREPESGAQVDEAEEMATETAGSSFAGSDGGEKKKSFFSRKKDKKDEQIEELTDRLKRTMAEFDNFRKRTEKEKAAMYEIGAKDIIEKILPVVDNFERGLATIPEGEERSAFAEGMDMIYKQLMKMLDEAGCKPIEAVGQPFDPNFHNAVMHVDDENLGENVVAEEFQKGYLYRDSVVRHSMVKVAN